MKTTAEVYLWGTRVGIIHQELDKLYASFVYHVLKDNSTTHNNFTVRLFQNLYENISGM